MKSSSLQAKLFLIWYRLRYPIRGFIVIGFFVSGYLTWRNLTLSTNVTEAEAIARMWKVKSIDDGDTFTVTKGNESMKVKLCGVDAPKSEQPLGIESTKYLRSLLSPDEGRVNLIEVGKDKNGFTLAEVFAGTGKIDENVHVNTTMIQTGHAWLDRASSQKCRYAEELGWAENIAKEDKLGVYKNKNAI
jgi:endonuclease YncB( thermonuclease family)